MKGNDTSIIMDKEEILERFPEYIGELCDYNQGHTLMMHNNIEGQIILPFEIRAALKNLKNYMASGPDGIVHEMVKALDGFGIEKIANLVNQM